MQAAAAAAAACFMSPLPVRSPKASLPISSNPHSSLLKPRAVVVTSSETSTIDYSSSIPVSPMEACQILGGDACNARMFPEAKLAAAVADWPPRRSTETTSSTTIPKLCLFPGEACDDLGGEFCEAEHQNGVY